MGATPAPRTLYEQFLLSAAVFRGTPKPTGLQQFLLHRVIWFGSSGRAQRAVHLCSMWCQVSSHFSPGPVPWWALVCLSVCLSPPLFRLAGTSPRMVPSGESCVLLPGNWKYFQEMEASGPARHYSPHQHHVSVLSEQPQDPPRFRGWRSGPQLWVMREGPPCRRAGRMGETFTAIFGNYNLLQGESQFCSCM